MAAWLWLPQRSWVALAAGPLGVAIRQGERGADPMSSVRGPWEKLDSVSAWGAEPCWAIAQGNRRSSPRCPGLEHGGPQEGTEHSERKKPWI